MKVYDQGNFDEKEKTLDPLEENENLNRLNQLDIPGLGDIEKAKNHGKANMLYKIDLTNIKQLEGKLLKIYNDVINNNITDI